MSHARSLDIVCKQTCKMDSKWIAVFDDMDALTVAVAKTPIQRVLAELGWCKITSGVIHRPPLGQLAGPWQLCSSPSLCEQSSAGLPCCHNSWCMDQPLINLMLSSHNWIIYAQEMHMRPGHLTSYRHRAYAPMEQTSWPDVNMLGQLANASSSKNT